MNPRLLETKFHIPSWRPGGVMRPRLWEQLQRGLQEGRKLTLISAPAGYGKTTLVAEWIAAKGKEAFIKVAWLSLDETDNDPARFFQYWLAALHHVDLITSGYRCFPHCGKHKHGRPLTWRTDADNGSLTPHRPRWWTRRRAPVARQSHGMAGRLAVVGRGRRRAAVVADPQRPAVQWQPRPTTASLVYTICQRQLDRVLLFYQTGLFKFAKAQVRHVLQNHPQ